MTVLHVPRRFCGPPASGNGGWTAGALAVLVGAPGPVEVTLRRPPPLEVAMPVQADGERQVARWGEDVIAEARPVSDKLTPVEPVDPVTAGAAEATYAGHRGHPFPTCFSCGPARDHGDGLRIFPGLVGPDRVAATWRPTPDLADPARPDATTAPVTWAALDCVSAWAADVAERPMVLGRMTACIDAAPLLDDLHVVTGEVRGEDGRKTFTASTLYDPDGRIVARAEHVWIRVDPAAFGPGPTS